MDIRKLCLSLLCDYENNGKYVNLSLSSHMTDSLSHDERRLLTSLLYTVCENKLTYDYYITSISKRSITDIDPTVLNILRIGMCQIADMASVPEHAAVNTSVKLAGNQGERSFVNAVLRKAASLFESNALPLPPREKNLARHLSVKYSYPLWIVKHFISLFGDEQTEKLLSHYNKVRYTDLTVNTRRISREDFAMELRSRGIDAVCSEESSLTVRIYGSVNPTKLYGFDEGLFYVQDAASAVSAEALGTEEGDRVIDVCACPGGKSFAAAIFAGEMGEVLSLDIHESKLSLIESGAQRLGLNNIKIGCNDAEKAIEGNIGKYDRVICDVPCSGLGVIAKKPDLRYKDNKSLQNLPDLQYNILNESVKYLKNGGYILYSTCTLNPDENEKPVERFISENDGYELVDFKVGARESKGGMLTLIPHIDMTDGFFMAKLRKVK